MLKPINREQTVSVISVIDSAIDPDRSEKRPILGSGGEPALAYVEERLLDPSSWRRLVQFKDGESPTEFIIGIVPSSQFVRISDECRASPAGPARNDELCWRMFLASLRDIKGFEGAEDAPKVTVDGMKYVDPAWVRKHFVGHLRRVAIEIGSVAYAWNKLGEADVKN